MVNEALEYFRSLENVVFVAEFDNGEDWEDRWTSVGTVAYRSIDQLIEEEKMEGRVIQAIKNDEHGEEVGDRYELTFVTDRNSTKITKLRDKVTQKEDEIWGSGKEDYAKLTEKQQERKQNQYHKLFGKLSGIENDHSSVKILVLELK